MSNTLDDLEDSFLQEKLFKSLGNLKSEKFTNHLERLIHRLID